MKRLANNKGFTMVEMLVCVIILLMIAMMCSTGFGIAVKSYQASLYESDSQMLQSTLDSYMGDILRHSRDVHTDATGNVTDFTNTAYKIQIGKMEVRPLTASNGGMLLLYKDPTDTVPDLAISSKIYGDDLYIADFEMSYDNTTKLFTGKYKIKSRILTGKEKECEFAYRSIAE